MRFTSRGRQTTLVAGAIAILLLGLTAGILLARESGSGDHSSENRDAPTEDNSAPEEAPSPSEGESSDPLSPFDRGQEVGKYFGPGFSDPSRECELSAERRYPDDPVAQSEFMQGCLYAVPSQ